MFLMVPKKSDYRKILPLFIILLFTLAMLLAGYGTLKLTGYVTLDLEGKSYYTNQTITGDLYLTHSANEFLPAQTIVNAKLAEKEVNLTLEQLILSSNAGVEKRFGNFYVENTSINGTGEGYNIEGGGTILLNLGAFDLRAEKEGKYDLFISSTYDDETIATSKAKITIKSCTPNWKQKNTTCQEDDTITAYYEDKNKCYEKTGQISHLEGKPQNLTFSCDFCKPNWKQYNTSCGIDDTKTGYYEDTKSCYEKTGLDSDLEGKPENITSSCDYCIPQWKQHNASCNADDTKIAYYKDAKSCYEKTALVSDLLDRPENLTFMCDYCEPNWKAKNTSCAVDDTLTTYYTDSKNCYDKTGLNSDLLGMPENLTFSCDYCIPQWKQHNASCGIDDAKVTYYKDTKSCYNKTGLDSDLEGRPENVSIACDFCKPKWVAVNTCLEGDLLVTWYNDTKSCYEMTGLISDLLGRLENVSKKFACDYEGNNILGGISDINTTLGNLAVYVAESSNLAQYFTDLQHVIFKENSSEIFEFNFNFSASKLELANLIIQKQAENSTKGFIVINGLNLTSQNKTKTVYVDRLANGASVCVSDEENAVIEHVSDKCDGMNEILIRCPGFTEGYVCELNSTLKKYKISGLKHSAVIEQEAFCGDESCNGDESCSTCSVDCGECPAPSQSTSEGGGTPSGGCLPKWECSEWSACTDGKQTRKCINTKEYCPVEINKPAEEQECEMPLSNETLAEEEKVKVNETSEAREKEITPTPAPGLVGSVVRAIGVLPVRAKISFALTLVSVLIVFITAMLFFRLIRKEKR